MRRRLNTDPFYWHCRYIGTPEPNAACPTIVRKTIDSLIYSKDMMEFVKCLGLRFVKKCFFYEIFSSNLHLPPTPLYS